MSPQDRIDELEEEVRQLRALLTNVNDDIPDAWKLSALQRRMIGCLMSRPLATHEQLWQALSRGRILEPSNLNVQLYKLRRKLAPFGVKIVNVHGVGFKLRLPE